MNKDHAHKSQALAGTEPYGTVNTLRTGIEVQAILPAHIKSNTELAPPSGIEYVHPYDTCHFMRPLENGDSVRCGAPRAKGTDYCIGHLKRKEKEEASTEQEDKWHNQAQR